MREKKKLIIDTDGLSDDVRAISLALQSQNAEVAALTTTHGCISVDQVTANVSRTLRANGKQVPIYKGAANSFLVKKKPLDETSLFGQDGISDRPNDFPSVMPEDFNNFVQNKHAAQALIDLCREEEGKITLVCLAALTNVALALKLDPSFAKAPKRLVIMGGNYYAIGNVNSMLTAEFNFFADPEAAQIVLSEMRCPITIVPWEAFFIEGKRNNIKLFLEMREKTKLIIDTDGLSDDVRAISLALQSHDSEVVALTTTHGCISVDQVTANVSRTLRANGKQLQVYVDHEHLYLSAFKVLIYKGAANPFLVKKKPLDETSLFGQDGISDRPNDFPSVIPEDFNNFVQKKHAAEALIDLCRKEEGKITLVCLAALTNVALA
uniref:IU_nuc_hydro domain-containing protein n=1 Tax=Steinernema glaseri TaxID=37863 RepID=A0A1I7ZEJ5_9BILA